MLPFRIGAPQNPTMPFTNVVQNERHHGPKKKKKRTRRVLRNNFISIKSWLRIRAKYGRTTVMTMMMKEAAKKKVQSKTLELRQTNIGNAASQDENALMCTGTHTYTRIECKWMNEWMDGSVCFLSPSLVIRRLCCYFGFDFWCFCSCCSCYFLRCRLTSCSFFFLSFAVSSFLYCFGLVLLLLFSCYSWLLFHLMLNVTSQAMH